MAAERSLFAALCALALGCASPAARPSGILVVDDLGAVDVPSAAADAGPATADGAGDDGGFTAGLPPGLVADSAPLYRFDAVQARFVVAITGDAQHRLAGVLRDAVGRRELYYDDFSFAPAGWNLPPVAAVTTGGATLVCFNTLTGPHTALSSTEAPDPSRGMTLSCRLRDAAGVWGPPVTARTATAGAWLQGVAARADGSFRVLYYGDDGFLVGPRGAAHGVYETLFNTRTGALSTPTLILPASEPGGA